MIFYTLWFSLFAWSVCSFFWYRGKSRPRSQEKPKSTLPKPEVNFEIPIYGGRVYLYRSQTDYENAVVYYGQSVDLERSLRCGESSGFNVKDGGRVYLVGWYDTLPETLLHESLHLTFNLLRDVVIDPTEDSGEEAFCYLQEEIFRSLSQDKLYVDK